MLDEYKNLDGVVQIDDDEEFFKDKSDDAIVNSMRFPKFDFATKVDSAFKKKLTEKKYQNEAIVHYTKAISIAPDQEEIEKIELDQDVDLVTPADLYMARGNVYSWMNNKYKKACNDWKVSKKLGNEDARDSFRDWRC